MTRMLDLTRMLRQLSPRASIERVPEVDETDGRVEVVVPSDWAGGSDIRDGQLVLKDGSGRQHVVSLPRAVDGGSALESFGNLALLRLPCARVAPEPAREESKSTSQTSRHLGHRGAMGAA